MTLFSNPYTVQLNKRTLVCELYDEIVFHEPASRMAAVLADPVRVGPFDGQIMNDCMLPLIV